MVQHEVFRDGRVHVLSEKCSTCIFRKTHDGRLLGLAPGRVAGMVLDARADPLGAGNIPCHSTYFDEGVLPAICRGFYDLPKRPMLLQAAERMGLIVFDDPPPEVER